MTLFDLEEPAQVPKTRRAKKAAKKTRRDQEAMPGLEPPRPAWSPPPAKLPDVAGIERVSQQIRSSLMYGGNDLGSFRCDAITHTLVLMFAQQMEYSARAPLGSLLHAAEEDGEYVQTWEWLLRQLQWMHPTAFPPQDLWPEEHLRRWERLWAGVDMIGARGRLAHDVVALTFQSAASMTGKQKAWGAFYTPYNVCILMAEMVAGDRPWVARINDPCVGAGSLLVAMFDVVRWRLLELGRAGHLTNDEIHRLMRQWISNVTAMDVDPEAVWTTGAQLAVRSGYPIAVRHPYRHPEGRQ